MPSAPWMCRSPKKERFQPVKGNQAIGAGTLTLMPIMPALKRRRHPRARADPPGGEQAGAGDFFLVDAPRGGDAVDDAGPDEETAAAVELAAAVEGHRGTVLFRNVKVVGDAVAGVGAGHGAPGD